MDTMDFSAIRDSITCPITGDIMTDPVQGNDGHTYERTAIMEWLSRNQTSPQTRAPMYPSDLKVNASIHFLCDKYHSGAFGAIDISTREPAKISSDKITIDHTNSRISNGTTYLSFNVNNDSFPKNLENGHLSQDVVVVIDHSGSMNAAVEAKDQDGKNLENGMSVQDIVNHAAKTVAKTLDKNSRLAVVIFDNNIERVTQLTYMTEMNQSTTLAKINNIKPGGQTNLWGGIIEAINILDERDDKSRNSAILILTDGVPNISPARGEVDTLKKLRIKKNFTAPIYTFGFGYNLQRELLYDIAKYANGANGHIPDGGMIATVFCNFTGTILSTVAMNLQLHITSIKGTPTDKLNNLLMGDFPSNYNQENECMTFDLGTIQYQQSRDIILNTKNGDELSYYFTYKIGGASTKSAVVHLSSIEETDSTNITDSINRFKAVEDIRTMLNYNRIGDNREAMKVFDKLVKNLKSQSSKTSLLTGLIKNLEGDGSSAGQVKLAISNIEYFKKWGEFYIDQLARSLNQQIKPNFKDEACLFGGDTFNDIVDRASDIFDTLPPPEPSLINQTLYRSYGGGSVAPTRAVSLAAYNDPNGGCFDSNCLITMADGTKKILKNVEKGDLVKSADLNNNITPTKVVCVFEMNITTKIREFVDFEGGLFITPWHPIKYNDKWVFPADIKSPIIKSCDSIITLVLENNHIAFINGHQCIMLGHGYTNGVLNHPYYGTQAIIDDLKLNYGWDSGKVVINDNDIEFIKNDNKISKMVCIRSPPTLISVI
jgi:Mg-chelatase subunit ChlD